MWGFEPRICIRKSSVCKLTVFLQFELNEGLCTVVDSSSYFAPVDDQQSIPLF